MKEGSRGSTYCGKSFVTVSSAIAKSYPLKWVSLGRDILEYQGRLPNGNFARLLGASDKKGMTCCSRDHF